MLTTGVALGLTAWLHEPWARFSPFFLLYAAVAISSWHGGLGPGVLSVAISAAAADYYLLPPDGWVTNIGDLDRLVLFTLVGILIASLNGALHQAKRRYELEAAAARNSLTERQRAEAEAKQNQEHLRNVGAELMIAEERERRRIATVLHDSVVQMLALAKLKIDAARRGAAGPGENGAARGNGASDGHGSADPRLSEAYDLIDQAIAQARTLTADISPPVLYELGLGPAIQWLGDRLRSDHGLAVEFEWDRQRPPLSEETRIVLFQAVRELMVNVAKHARASVCRVRMRHDEASGALAIIVEDDGCGYCAPATLDYAKGGFGLFNIRERLVRLGGSVRIEARPGGGTAVTVTAPLAHAPEAVA
ncbi:MAG TPA: sensor histidine kinase [Tepidisphaeraceae bacterium]